MKVLILAPSVPSLPGVLQEVQEVANTLGAKVVQGVMTDEKITNVVRRFGPFDLTIYAGHLGEEGFPRGDESHLPMDRFTMMLGDTEYIFINACDGVQLVDMIRSRTAAHVITATGSIDDDMALQAMRTFSDGVADTGDVQFAFGRLRETRQYELFKNRAAPEVNRSSNDTFLSKIDERLTVVEADIHRLTRIVLGDDDLDMAGLKMNVKHIIETLDTVQDTIAKMRQAMQADETPEFLRKYAAHIVVLVFALLIVSIVVQYVP